MQFISTEYIATVGGTLAQLVELLPHSDRDPGSILDSVSFGVELTYSHYDFFSSLEKDMLFVG